MTGKTILVTGGTGSLSQVLISQLMRTEVEKVIVFSRDEHKQVDMERTWKNPDDPIRYILGDVRDRECLYRAFVGVDVVIHTAALKHVHKGEYSPLEFVKTNVIGAQNIIDAAIDRGVEKVLAISSDKAVNPVNLYGATKLCGDKLFVAGNSYSGKMGTRFSVIRFGNFWGSRGSVVPLFERMTREGSRVLPIMDMRMTRFFITLETASESVIQCVDMMAGGEIFTPHMPSMLITDLAHKVNPKAELVSVQIRPGEKIHEDLITETDMRNTYEIPGFYVTYPSGVEGHGKKVKEGFVYSSKGG